MNSSPKLGISHILNSDAEIIHTTILGRMSLGRVSDLSTAWVAKKFEPDQRYLGDLRVLIQALLEFSCPSTNPLGQIEMGEAEGILVMATRFESSVRFEHESIEKDLTQFWLNSDEAKLLKKVLYPQDRVEVRYLSKLNLIEWRVIRELEPGKLIEQDSSFLVLIDFSDGIESASERYVDLGDLPFEEWLTDVYRNKHEKTKSGEVLIGNDASQDESEWARIVSDREAAEIDQLILRGMRDDDDEQKVEYQFSNGEQDEKIAEKSNQYSDELVSKLLAEQSNLKENLKRMVLEGKQNSLRDKRELLGLNKKIDAFEKLLKQKELINQMAHKKVQIMQSKIEEDRKKREAEEKGNHFRVKALEMFEMLKKVKEEKTNLEKTIFELKNKKEKSIVADLEPSGGSSISSQKQIEELTKKVERTERAFNAEKAKIKSLSERVIIAEREAQSAAPMVKDLESKVEHTLKTAQQHKKETEAVKQKLVQSEAEKNKIKNELVKAQAQIQTLMKRQAA